MPRNSRAAAAVEPIDRVATFLDHADESTDVVQFSERNAAGRWVYQQPRAELADVRALGIEEYLADRFGGGSYKVQLRHRSNGSYGQSIVVEIGGPVKSAADRAAAQRSTSGAPAAIAPAATISNPPNWVTQMILPIGVTFATAAGTFLAKKILEGPKTDPLYVELIRNMQRNNAPAPAMPFDPMTMMNSMLELQDRLEKRIDRRGGERGPASSLGEVIDRQLPEVLKLVGRKLSMEERRGRLPPTPAPAPDPAQDAGPADDAARVANAPGDADMTPLPADPLARLLLQIPLNAREFLLDAAANDEVAELYAEIVLNRFDDDVLEQMRGLLPRADFVDVLLQVIPAYAEYRPWFVQLVDAMRASIEEPQDLDDASENGERGGRDGIIRAHSGGGTTDRGNGSGEPAA